MVLTSQEKNAQANEWFDSVPDTGVLRAFGIGLSQTVTALEESFSDLTNEQLNAFPIAGRNNIAWIVMHCLHSLDFFAVSRQTADGASTIAWDARWAWGCPRPKPEESYPSGAEMQNLLQRIRANALAALANTTEADLPRHRNASTDETAERSYNRVIHHLNMHIRQIWLLRGLQGVTTAWPERFRGKI